MRIAIIGGSGFIGTRLADQLISKNAEIVLIDKRMSKKHESICEIADVMDVKVLEERLRGCDEIINLAAEHKDNVSPKSLYFDVNVKGAENVCNAARKNGIRKIIFTSSVAVYGFAERDTGENGARNPFNEYGRTKMLAEDTYKAWLAEDKGRSLAIIRPTVVFGENNRGNVYNLLKQMSSGKFVMVGNGENVKSMAYVENLAGFLEYALGFGPGEYLYNYVDKEDFTMNELVELTRKMMGRSSKIRIRLPYFLGYMGGLVFDFLSNLSKKEFPISAIRVKKFCSDTQFASRVRSETGFTPPVSLREGLERTIRYEFLEKAAGADQEIFVSE
jgi:GlcNAc-P-P-Und epimerase